MTSFSDDIPTEKRSLSQIEFEANRARKLAGLDVNDKIEILRFLSRLDISAPPKSDGEMGNAEALAVVTNEFSRIFVRRSLSKALREADPAACYKIGHEVGHLFLHRTAEAKPLVVGGNSKISFVPEDERTEPQAWKFSRALFLPRDLRDWHLSDAEIAVAKGIPAHAVTLRRSEIETAAQQELPKRSVAHLVSANLKNLQTGFDRLLPISPTSANEKFERRKLELWGQLPHVMDRNPAEYRMCGKFLICWRHYQRPHPPSDYGWHVRRDQIVSYMEEFQ